jgi:hypothetical protein
LSPLGEYGWLRRRSTESDDTRDAGADTSQGEKCLGERLSDLRVSTTALLGAYSAEALRFDVGAQLADVGAVLFVSHVFIQGKRS